MPSPRITRARVLRAYDHADTITILGADGALRRLEGDSAELVRAILGFVATPRSRAELFGHLSELAGAPIDEGGTVAEALALLEAAGAVHAAPAPAPRPDARARTRVVLGLTGAVAAAFAPVLVELLQRRGFEVRVAATENALRFTGALALEALTHAPVVAGLWPRDPGAPVPHLDLARWAELMVVYPASATSIARLAAGSCDTVVSAAAIATRAPVLVVPSMNEAMYTAPSVQRNLAQLREDGFLLAHPSCGIEVADAPGSRVPMLGAAPPVDAVADLVEAIAGYHGDRAVAAAPAWDDVYRDRPPGELPWFTEELDPDIARLLGRIDRGDGRLLDLGTGPGTAAIAASDRGFFVVATDVSPRALDLARRRAGDRPIVWLRDDVLDTRIRGAFDVVLDRGLLHVLPRERQADYAAAVRALVRPGGHLVLKCHAADEPGDHGTQRFGMDDLAGLMGDAFDVVHAEDTVFPGPGGRAPKALLVALVRRRDDCGPANASTGTFAPTG
jgi:SAM-dependent methyltransferase/3-polyprenyl-4-hydroxybenzoate decarboxylase